MQVQADVEEFIEKISSTFQEFGLQEANIFTQLDSLEQLLQEQEAAALQPLPELADGPDEVRNSPAVITCRLSWRPNTILQHAASQDQTLCAGGLQIAPSK